MIYTVSFKPKNIDEIQRIEVDATDEKDAKEKAKQKVSGPVGEISIVSIVKGGHVVKGPKHFEALTEIKDGLFDAPSDVKEAFNNVTEYFAKKSPEETYKDWIKALKIGEKALKMLSEIDAVNCILSGGDPFIWEEGTENIDKIKTKLESQVNHIKRLLKNRGVKYFDSINLKGKTIEVFSVTGSHNDNVSKHIVIDIDKEENIRKEIRYIIKCQDKFIVDLSESEYKELVSEGFTLGSGWNGGYTIVTLSGLDNSRGKKYRK